MKKILEQFWMQVVCLFAAFLCLFPLVWMVSSSLKTNEVIFRDFSILPKKIVWSNYFIAWTKGNFGVYFFNSVIYTVFVVLGILIIASLAAFAISRLKMPYKNFIFFLLISTMMIPIPGSFVALFVLLNKLGLVNTRTGYILCQINGGLALAIFLLKTFFDRIPKELEESAIIDGCNKFKIYYYIALPIARPAIAVVTIFNILAVWNEYILAMLILSDKSMMPLQRGLMVFYGAHLSDYSVLMAGLTITVIPVLVAYFFMQRYIISGIIAGALKG